MSDFDDRNDVSSGRLPPIDGASAGQRNTRRLSGDRQRGIDVPATSDKSADRKYSPAQIDRRQRSLTLTLPTHELLSDLKQEAELLSEKHDQFISPTRLATMLLVQAFDQYKDGQLEFTFVNERVEKMAILPVEDDE